MATLGFVWRLAWANPYTSPPDGGPRVLAEIFVPIECPGQGSKRPAALLTLHKPGSGYAVTSQALAAPIATRSPAQLAATRQKRLRRRLQAQAPLFAEDFIAAELAAKSDYYAGITDPTIERERNEVLAAEAVQRARFLSHPHHLFRYDEE